MLPPQTGRRHHPFYLFVTGLCMGSADVVPGVSGGTIAFIMGVYHDLLNAIKSFEPSLLGRLARGQWRATTNAIPWRFLIPLVLGVVTAVLSLAEVLTYLLHQHESLLFAFFFGLVTASILALAGRSHWPAAAVAACVAAAGCAYWIVALVPAQPGHSPLILFTSGAVAICAMILPGISGSFILLVLGQYEHCVGAISQLLEAVRAGDLSTIGHLLTGTIIPAAAGMALGLAIFARLLSWLLAKHGRITIAALIGFMIGSLRRLWPFKEYLEFGLDRHGDPIPLRWTNVAPALDDPIGLALLLFLAGFVAISAIDHVYDRRNPLILAMTRVGWWSKKDAAV